MNIDPLLRRASLAAVAAAALALTGCGSITGIGSTSEYACKAPPGVQCESVSGNYHNAQKNNLPSQRRASTPPARAEGSASGEQAPSYGASGRTAALSGGPRPGTGPLDPAAAEPGYVAQPLRAHGRVLRLWIKPWEDSDADLNSESHVYVQVDEGRWLVEHAQHLAREPYAPSRPVRSPTAAPAKPAAEGAKPVAAVKRPTSLLANK